MKSKLIKSLTPIKTKTNGNECKINVWNRTYTLSSAPFFSSIISGGKELLASPMRIVGEENGKPFVFEDITNAPMHTNKSEESVTVSQYMHTARFIFNNSLKADYDGTAVASSI